jgi:C-terminal processing protease CtpA/Prc
VYAGTPAAHAGILPGDELLTVDGEPYSPVKVFQGKVGKTVKLALRRVQNGPALEIEVAVAALNPLETLTISTANSSKVIEREGLKFGYVRMYSYAGDDYKEFLINTLSSDSFASANALILDMRGRWGGAPPDAAEMFVGGSPNVEFITPANETHSSNFRWTKPMVAIIGPETRSGLEIMAYSLKKAGIPVVGTTTRGAVLGGSAFILQNGSLLLIPVVDVKIDGNRLEGVGVSPTIEVNAALEYSQGNDPQLEAALDKISTVPSSPSM